MKITTRAISSIRPYETNPRTIGESAISAVAVSIREFGFRQPIVVDSEGVIIAGHTRYFAAQKLGLEKVPLHVATDLSPEQIRAYRIADNKTGELAEWNLDLLSAEITGLQDAGFDLDSLGFDADELTKLIGGGTQGLTDPDEVPDPPKIPVCKPGDLWILGEHRLLCGDSTKAEEVSRLMNGERAGLMNTDPPYGIAYANDDRPNPGVAKPRVAKPRVAKPRVANDELSDEVLQQFLESCFSTAVASALQECAAWYLWHANLTQGYFAAAAATANVVLHRQIIWVKPVLLLGRGHYHWKHEPCFMGWVKGHQPPDYGLGNGERTQTTVWEIGQISQADRKEFNHSSPKPVGLFEIPLVKHLKQGEIAYEPFSGSGPQFIAAEQHGRKCYGLELEPRYCDVIITRWEKFTGRKAQRA